MIEAKIDNTGIIPVNDFPKLMISDDAGEIVLMTDHHTGTVVYQGPSEYEIGYESTGWIIDKFTDYDGSVTLNNR